VGTIFVDIPNSNMTRGTTCRWHWSNRNDQIEHF